MLALRRIGLSLLNTDGYAKKSISNLEFVFRTVRQTEVATVENLDSAMERMRQAKPQCH
jgi:hypothetical protein